MNLLEVSAGSAPFSTKMAAARAYVAYAFARRSYETWLNAKDDGFFAPASREEVLALYDKTSNPLLKENAEAFPLADLGEVSLCLDVVTEVIVLCQAVLQLLSAGERGKSHLVAAELLQEAVGALCDISSSNAATVTITPSNRREVAMTHQLDLTKLSEQEWENQMGGSAKDDKTLTAKYKGGAAPQFLVEDHSHEPPRLWYSGYSLKNAVECYNSGVSFDELPKPRRVSIQDVIAETESIPERKVALNRARVRRALASIQYDVARAMPDEQMVAELCKTPEGRAQYEKIAQGIPGDRYLGPRSGTALTIDELVVGLFNTPEGRAEFEEAGRGLRSAVGLQGPGGDLLTSVAKAALFLLQKSRHALADGLAPDGPLEAEKDRLNKALVGRMDAVLDNYLAKELLE
jgi:hypothetical protein